MLGGLPQVDKAALSKILLLVLTEHTKLECTPMETMSVFTKVTLLELRVSVQTTLLILDYIHNHPVNIAQLNIST